jgi:disulfide oxidoreductase YuzD
MPKYEVRIDLNSITYEIEADNEDEAVEFAEEIVYDNTMYDLLKWADYTVEEMTNA